MADYSEFPTTPTGWQERQAQDWETVTPLSTEDPAPPRAAGRPRRPDPGRGLQSVLAIVLMTGVRPAVRALARTAGSSGSLLIGGGIALLLSELRKARRRR